MRYDKKALKRLLVERGIDEQTIARRSGVGSRTVYYLARGLTMPRADTLGKLAHALDVAADAFYIRKEPAA